MEHGAILFMLSCLFGFFMAWGIGANDVANVMGTSVGSKAISVRTAILIAACCEFAGALLAGGQVTDTIRSKIVDTSLLSISPEILVYGMLASLLSAGTWLAFASAFGWPVSTTHSIVGAIIGFAVVTLGPMSIHWFKVLNIIMSWIVTPIISGITANLVFLSIQKYIINTDRPLRRAKYLLPFYVFFVSVILCIVTLTEGLKHIGLSFTFLQSTLLTLGISSIVVIISIILIHRVRMSPSRDEMYDYLSVERAFAALMVFTAMAMAFAHGSNDVANAIGPLSAVIAVIESGGQIGQQSPLAPWVLFLGASGIVLGLATFGYRVMATIGHRITDLTPTRGFSAEFATACTVVLASGLGLPVSTTQTLVGAILGIGLARGIAALNLLVIRNIFVSWVITLPIGASLSVIYYIIIKYSFS